MGMFDLIIYVSINILFPLGGILVTLFVAHVVDIKIVKSELGLEHSKYANILFFHAKYIIPLALLVVFASGL
jgi:SNF family Na+-dependent transporter